MIIIYLYLFTATIFGIFIGYFFRKYRVAKKIKDAEAKASIILNKAKEKEKDILLKAKEKSLQILENAKKEIEELKSEITRRERRLEKREEIFDKKLLDLEQNKKKIQSKIEEIENVKKQIDEIREAEMRKLEEISGLSKEEAKDRLFKKLEEIEKVKIAERIKKLQTEARDILKKEAEKIILTAMEKVAVPISTELTISTITLPSDEMKGRIIGKEGRNIRTLEQLLGVEIIVDDTPQAIFISSFNPLRRYLAKKVVEYLISDGRIQPARIEETVEKMKKELIEEIKKAGEDAAYYLGIVGLDPKIIQLMGRLKFRTSYGQNVLQHSMEVAILSKGIAEELGADVSTCLKGGFLHDIGKAVDWEVQGSHPKIGYEIMKKFGLPEEVAYLSLAPHEDNPKSLEGIIVKVADAISGTRPGARKDSYENYIQRLTELENVALKFPGVKKAYAIQAGREVRVFVEPREVDDIGTVKLARDIANRIEEELKYPGEIKVNVIRELRVEEYAR